MPELEGKTLPAGQGAAQDLSDTLDTLGQSRSALTEYQQSLSHLRALSQDDPLDTRVSRQLATNHDSIGGAVANGGTTVVFQSKATNLVADDTNAVEDIFVNRQG